MVKIKFAKRVRCLETGEVWESRKACAEAIGISAPQLYEHMRFKEPIRGMMYVDDNNIN